MSIISKLHQCPNTLRAEFEKKQADLMASYGLTESEIANPYNPVRAMYFAEKDAVKGIVEIVTPLHEKHALGMRLITTATHQYFMEQVL